MPLVLEPETDKLFPESHRARHVRDRLMERSREAGVSVRFGVTVTGLRPPRDEADAWAVELEGTPPLHGDLGDPGEQRLAHAPTPGARAHEERNNFV